MYRTAPIAVLFVGPGVAVGDDLGQQWRACARCAAHIEADDQVGLLERTLAHAPAVASRAELADTIRPLQAAFLSARLPGRTPISPAPPPVSRIRAEALPKVRDRLADYWTRQAPGRLATALSFGEPLNMPADIVPADTMDAGATALNATVTRPDVDTLAAFGTGVADDLRRAELFWVDATFTQLAKHAGQRLPDLAVDPEQIPAERGLIVWADPIDTLDVDGRRVPIVAAHWTRLSAGIWTCCYTPTPPRPTTPQAEPAGWLAPIGSGVGLPYHGADIADATTRGLLATLVATWLLIDQPTLAETGPTPVDARIRRSYARAGRPDPQVRLVRLRPRPARAPDADSVGGGREYSHRWWVDPYWRDQPYGPGRALRRRRLVAGSVRGPHDKPLVLKPTVRVLGSTGNVHSGPDHG